MCLRWVRLQVQNMNNIVNCKEPMPGFVWQNLLLNFKKLFYEKARKLKAEKIQNAKRNRRKISI